MSVEPREGERIGRYQVRGPIGRGTAGAVYRAVDTASGREVAVKLFPATVGDGRAAQPHFEDRAARLRGLRSPFLVPIEEVGSDQRFAYVVMPVFDRGDLRTRIAERGPVPVDVAFRLFRQVCSAVEAAHGIGLAHRRLKASNVLLWDGADGPQAAVGDVDLADTSGAGEPSGDDLATMAPERHQGRPGDERSDVYSLGCLLYLMLSGAPPFTGTSYQVVHAHLHQVTPRLPASIPASRALDDVVRAAMAKEPAERPGSVAELVGLLDGALAVPAADPELSGPRDGGTVAPTMVHGWSPDGPVDRDSPRWGADDATAARPHATWGPPRPAEYRDPHPSDQGESRRPPAPAAPPSAPSGAPWLTSSATTERGLGRWPRGYLLGVGAAAVALVAAAIVVPILLFGDDDLSEADQATANAIAAGAGVNQWSDDGDRACAAAAVVREHPTDELQEAGLVDASGTFQEEGWTRELAAAWIGGLVDCIGDAWSQQMADAWGAPDNEPCVADRGRDAMVDFLAAETSGTAADTTDQDILTRCLKLPPGRACPFNGGANLSVRRPFPPTGDPDEYQVLRNGEVVAAQKPSSADSYTAILLDPEDRLDDSLTVTAVYAGTASAPRAVGLYCD